MPNPPDVEVELLARHLAEKAAAARAKRADGWLDDAGKYLQANPRLQTTLAGAGVGAAGLGAAGLATSLLSEDPQRRKPFKNLLLGAGLGAGLGAAAGYGGHHLVGQGAANEANRRAIDEGLAQIQELRGKQDPTALGWLGGAANRTLGDLGGRLQGTFVNGRPQFADVALTAGLAGEGAFALARRATPWHGRVTDLAHGLASGAIKDTDFVKGMMNTHSETGLRSLLSPWVRPSAPGQYNVPLASGGGTGIVSATDRARLMASSQQTPRAFWRSMPLTGMRASFPLQRRFLYPALALAPSLISGIRGQLGEPGDLSGQQQSASSGLRTPFAADRARNP